LDVLALEDEPTLIVIPESVKLTNTDYQTLVQAVLLQCDTLKDRFAIFDIYNGDKGLDETPTDATETYLVSNRVYFGNNYLKYGAAYYPFLKTTMNFYVNEGETNVNITPQQAATATATATATVSIGEVTAVTVTAGGSGYTSAPTISFSGGGGTGATAKATVTDGVVTAVTVTTGGSGYTSPPNINFEGGEGTGAAATATVSGGAVTTVTVTTGGSGYTFAPTISFLGGGGTGATATATVKDGTVTAVTITAHGSGYTSAPTVQFNEAANLGSFKVSNTALYNSVKSTLKEHFVQLPPSGAVAGVYAATDSNRGVWKAPANVSLANVIEPVIKIDNAKQDGLNIDATSGKSINALRAFAGKGTLVWGARTLAGNDNEWRYISVRRFFNMVEESVKKSTYWAVFEPNDANTWVKVRGMIENYLTQKWREGAMAGATPKDAFFVKCGLGTTMTSQDILEGRMNVEIGMAVVRPAEFIILKFSHKLQTS
jgi:phage tail sheath protein FI